MTTDVSVTTHRKRLDSNVLRAIQCVMYVQYEAKSGMHCVIYLIVLSYFAGFILTSREKTLLLFNLVTVPGSMFIVINFLDFLHLMTWVSISVILLHYNCAL